MADTQEAPTQEDMLVATKSKAQRDKAAEEKREAKAAEKTVAEAAAAAAEPVVAAAEDEPEPQLRRKGQGPGRQLLESNVSYPKGIHGKDYEFYGPTGAAAVFPEGTEVAEYSEDQEFALDMSKLKTFKFQVAGLNLPQRARLYNIKGIHKDGRIVQLAFEGQIENTAGGDPDDAIGLRRYQRKGLTVLIDWATMMPLFCAAFDCWAQASQPDEDEHLIPLVPAYPGFCSKRHAVWTLPNKFKDSGEILQQMFGERATTSRIWAQD